VVAEPTVATPDKPLVDKDQEPKQDIPESQFAPVPIQKPLAQAQIESDIDNRKKQTTSQLAQSQDIFQQELQRETQRIQAA
jgi:hypothetical protein